MRVVRCTSKVKELGQRLGSATIHSFGSRGVALAPVFWITLIRRLLCSCGLRGAALAPGFTNDVPAGSYKMVMRAQSRFTFLGERVASVRKTAQMGGWWCFWREGGGGAAERLVTWVVVH